jgi:hypothetical protein
MPNTSELAELLLVKLYELANENDFSKMWILDSIAAEFGADADIELLRGIATSLNDRGLIRRIVNGRQIIACITSEGAMFVERGGATGIVAQYQSNPERFTVHVDQSTRIYGNVHHSNIASHSTSSRQTIKASPEAADLLSSVRAAIERDDSLSAERKAEAWADVELVRTELERSSPREEILWSALGTLGDISSIASLVGQLGAAILG